MFVPFHEWTIVIKRVEEKKIFLLIQSINIVFSNMEILIVVPITKRMEIIMSIQVCPISWININYKENGGRKSIPYQTKVSILYILMWRTWLQCPITKRVEIIMRIQVWLTSQMNFDYKENNGKKNLFLPNQWGDHDCSAQ